MEGQMIGLHVLRCRRTTTDKAMTTRLVTHGNLEGPSMSNRLDHGSFYGLPNADHTIIDRAPCQAE